MKELSQADYDTLYAFVEAARDNGTHYSGMTYEQGMEAVLDVLDGNSTAAEVTEV